jgi:TRAP transporter T-component
MGATATSLDEVARASNRQSNLKLIREGMPAYLMLMDGMIEAWPNNDKLLITAANASIRWTKRGFLWRSKRCARSIGWE